MKSKLYKSGLALLITGILLSCHGKKHESHSHAEDSADWPEMESFHFAMGEVYHPYKDSSNLEPIKSGADELASEADKWAKSEMPKSVNSEKIKPLLDKFYADTRALSNQVKAGIPDAQLGVALTNLHEEFHHLIEEIGK